MDRRTLLAVALSFMIFLAWQKLYIEPRMPVKTTAAQSVHPEQKSAPPTSTASQSATSQTLGSTPQSAPQVAPQTQPLNTQIGTATISNGNKFFSDWTLKSYKLNISPEAASVDLKNVTNQDGTVEFSFDDPAYGYLNQVRGNLSQTQNGVLWTYEDSNVKLTRQFTGGEAQPYLDVRVTAEFKSKAPSYAFLSLGSQRLAEKDPEEMDRQLVYWTLDKLERDRLKDISALKQVSSSIHYIGATSRYFLMTLVAEAPFEPKGLIQPLPNSSARMSMVFPMSGNSISIPVKAYFGPKELNTLRAVDPLLDHTVDLGFFAIVAYPLLKILKWFYALVKNYGVAIILLTILVKLVTFPLTYKSMKSMRKMAVIQPQLQKIREKHADDKEALNREMLSLMRTHGYNPMAGCLPILIQMPVFFALYRVLYTSIELYQAPFMFWIQDLAAKDPFYVTPVLMAITMFIQQKLTPNTATDPMQAKMIQFMPLIFGAFMLTLPSGLTLYMLVNAVTSIIQQLVMNKKLGPAYAAAPARAN